ncbi:MAG: hypothetical protein QM757_28340 [Paludibaculum sp.]
MFAVLNLGSLQEFVHYFTEPALFLSSDRPLPRQNLRSRLDLQLFGAFPILFGGLQVGDSAYRLAGEAKSVLPPAVLLS